jgi:hypothetical protein
LNRCLLAGLVAAASSFTLQPSKTVSTRVALSKEDTQRELLNQLDESYGYDGRLPSGGEDHRCGFACIVGAPNMGKVG